MRITKRMQIEEHLIQKGSITSLEAITEYWHTRLSGVIYKLRKEGWEIDSIPIPHKSGSYFAKYILVKIPINYYN